MKNFDVIIIGAGASGLISAFAAAKRGKRVCLIDHAKKIGSKILISGGGRCNFTNLNADAEKYLSKNKHFMKSALAQFSQYDFIELIKKHKIKYHEKTLGQLFCDDSATQIVDMLVAECQNVGVEFYLGTEVTEVIDNFTVLTSKGEFSASNLIMATGGLSIPKMGATNFGFRVAKQFGLKVEDTTPALVPFTFSDKDKEKFASLSGISFLAEVSLGKTSFKESVLFTHRGISGPAILQISSFWQPGNEIKINILPDTNWSEFLQQKKTANSKQELKTVLTEVLPKRFVIVLIEQGLVKNIPMGQVGEKYIIQLVETFSNFKIKPNGTEGYRKAEVTKGGVSTTELDSKTLESKKVPGLYFVGELVDVTGFLGGYNFQWAWSSGFVAGNNI